MRSRFYSLVLVSILLWGPPLFGQDLGQLLARASKLWEFRKQSNRLDALPFIDPETRKVYLQWNETPISSFKLSGVEFTEHPDHVFMLVKIHSLLPNIGEIDRV